MPEPPVNEAAARQTAAPQSVAPQPAAPAGTPHGANPAPDPLGPTVILPATAPAAVGLPAASPPGWFGKLPFLGDFASRRLPDSFMRAWDEWLQPGLAASRQATGEHWLELYLTFPVWRFVVPAGLIGDACWIGVLLPSVDRVGRCFPLTVCESVARSALEAAGLIGIDAHLGAVADAGVAALEASSIDAVEQTLIRLAPLASSSLSTASAAPAAAAPIPTIRPRPPTPPGLALDAWLRRSQTGAGSGAWPLDGPMAAVLATAASRFAVANLADRVLWWSPADATGAGGALLLEPYPFAGRLVGRLIGAA
jgi:type VI secretion system protein ImpM